jgi:DNA polymerase III delta prime subunit
MALNLNIVKFDDLCFHHNINTKLLRINKILNLGFIGEKGLGKKTRIYALIHKLYGEEISNISKKDINVKTKLGNINIKYLRSDIHIDIDMTIYKNQRGLIKEFLEPYMATISILNKHKKIVILRNVHNFKKNILKILSILINKYNNNVIFILLGKHIQCVKICAQITIIKFPDINENVLKSMIKNKYKKITNEDINNILIKSKVFSITNDLNNIFNLLKISIIDGNYIKSETNIPDIINEILDIIHKKSFKFTIISKIKELLYKIYSYNYPINIMIVYMLRKIIKKHGNDAKKNCLLHKLIKKSGEISENMVKTSKEIMHFEHFIIYYITLIHG